MKDPFSTLIKAISDKFYDLSVRLSRKGKKLKPESKSLSVQKKQNTIFYVSWIIVPLTIFVVRFIAINGNSLFLAFKGYDFSTGKSYWNGISNFKNVIADFSRMPEFTAMLWRSARVYVISAVVTLVIPVLFAYYIHKRLPLSKVFKVILFFPTIISGIVTITIFKTITERMVPTLMDKLFDHEMFGLLTNPSTTFPTIFFYALWMSFGGGLLVSLAVMNTVDESVTESARLEGISFLKELWHIVLPVCYPILSIGFVAGFSSLFTNDLGLYAFYGLNADARLWTIGYYFTATSISAGKAQSAYLASWGLIMSSICIPVTLGLRKLVLRVGPSED